ncbi:alpha-1,6-mannosylglycoprotein 6-beta-N-acetylglucosaminyltransferase A-like [Clytia hemisphaerica]|uniref:alpha-1,6-mannosyl-glycoprotein 6-beta-N-acetylglucosaminyltransferase n=1 Tax=Clytia hemisphaerica TaxID=252671 RepID=A0A7M5V8F4_9CNID|eukprot:TCONS_00057475-protein
MFESKKSKSTWRRWFSPLRFALIMISLVFIWSVFLFVSTQHLNGGNTIKESDQIKNQIIELSKKYISTLAKEKGKNERDIDETQKTAILLQSMLQRIDQLESQLQHVIVNSTSKFEKMVSDIQTLNHTIMYSLNGTLVRYRTVCHIPQSDPAYPHCTDKVEWLRKNWKSQKKFALKGVNGTVCSILEYLSNVEEECPKNFKITKQIQKLSGSKHFPVGSSPLDTSKSDDKGDVNKNNDPITGDCTENINDPAFPSCKNKISWLRKYWKSDAIYASHGVDGSMCSIVHYLSEVESWCPLQKGRQSSDKDCNVPKVAGYPNCDAKAAWMKKFWTSDPCYQALGVNGTICSFIVYLSEIERWCPLFPGHNYRELAKKSGDGALAIKPEIKEHTKLKSLLDILQVGGEKKKFDWMSSRITRLWPTWVEAQTNLNKKVDLQSYEKKKILIYIGLLADEANYHFGDMATKGGPLGELVQWSDIISSLYLLGHDLTVVLNKSPNNKYGIKKMLTTSMGGQCPTEKKSQYDLIYTDYIGLAHMIRIFKNVNSIKCYLRIVDSFGTEAQFNVKVDSHSKNLYGFHGLNLKQYNTMFPHSPDNSFLGFVVENHIKPGEKLEKKKRIALVYGKHINMWQDHKKIAFLDIVQKYFEIHATVGGQLDKKTKVKYALPSYVHNHGVLKGDEIQKLLRETTLFVGLGFPYEGPAPLEAIANGCFFLNVKLDPPLGRRNDKFFKSKPTERRLTSQHPYAERFIGKPHVYTVNISNLKEVEAALEDIDDKVVDPYLPYEFTNQGMMERLYMFTKHHDFCSSHLGAPSVNSTWPPMSARQVFVGEKDEGCDEVCGKKNLVCEPAYFNSINDVQSLPKCMKPTKAASIIAPAYKVDPKNSNRDECLIQTNTALFSCTAKSPSSERVCPCRDFVRGQTALCKDCLDGVR